MRYKNNINDYEVLKITSIGSGKRVNEDALTAVQLLQESKEIAFRIIGINYKTKFGAGSTFRTLSEAQGIAKPIIIDNNLYLVKNKYFEGFKRTFGSKQNGFSRRTTDIESITITDTIKPEATVDTIITRTPKPIIEIKKRTNASIVDEFKQLFKSAVNYSNLNISNYKTSNYYVLFKNIINDNFSSKLELINFRDYIGLANIDSTLNYILEDIISNTKLES